MTLKPMAQRGGRSDLSHNTWAQPSLSESENQIAGGIDVHVHTTRQRLSHQHNDRERLTIDRSILIGWINGYHTTVHIDFIKTVVDQKVLTGQKKI